MVLLENNTTYNVVFMHPIKNSVFGKLNFLQSIDKIKLLVIVINIKSYFQQKTYFFSNGDLLARGSYSTKVMIGRTGKSRKTWQTRKTRKPERMRIT